jgi:Tat protein secretion system quality control protein TatD with DNase activity
MRKKKNHSGFLHHTAEFTAEALGVDYETFVNATTENAKKLFAIKD